MVIATQRRAISPQACMFREELLMGFMMTAGLIALAVFTGEESPALWLRVLFLSLSPSYSRLSWPMSATIARLGPSLKRWPSSPVAAPRGYRGRDRRSPGGDALLVFSRLRCWSLTFRTLPLGLGVAFRSHRIVPTVESVRIA